MRIIDKNTDFYDYLQGVYRDSTFTFDRTDSFVVTKEIMCNHFMYSRVWTKERTHNFMLLQVGSTFWLFLVEITEKTGFNRPTDYTVELLATWKNYDRERRLISLEVISMFGVLIQCYSNLGRGRNELDVTKLRDRVDTLIDAINRKNYKVESAINHCTVYIGDTRVEKHIPLLKASGLASCIADLEIFLAFEEYFSMEKTASERTEALGTTNRIKVESHGFDYVTSFRGKQQ